MSAPTEVQRLGAMASALRRIRLVCAAFTLLQFALYVPPQGLEPPYPLWPIAVGIIAWLLLTNVVSRVLHGSAEPGRLHRAVTVELGADALVALAIVVSFNFDPTLRLWPVLSLPILEAAMRLSLRPTMVTWAAIGLVYALDQIRLMPSRDDPATWIGHIPYALGILLIIGLISGLLSSRLEHARDRAERSADELRRLSDVSRGISATRDTAGVVGQLLEGAVALTDYETAEFHSSTAGRWQREERLADEDDPVLPVSDYDLQALTRDPLRPRVVDPDTGPYRRVVMVCLPRREGAFGALAVGTRTAGEHPPLDVLQLLAAQAAVALDNAALLQQEAHTIEHLRALHGMKDDFVSMLTHELRSPLTSVTGYADMLRRNWERITEDDRERFLEAIERNGAQLTRLIDDVLEASRAERGSLVATPQDVDLPPLVKAVAEEEVGPAADHHLKLELDADLPLVHADPDRVRQVVRNLVNNAVKYSPQGGDVLVTLSRRNDAVRLSIIDDGIGIAPQHQDQLFEKFSRVPSRAHVRGTGLGLFLSRQLVEQMGGRIGVESGTDQGSTFWVELPAADQAG